ncbi:MAG: hypothetical protein LBT15_06365 [Synergistaceae bacterium]|jgi:hypothetical protein|nr:hypothetical protein [Synergistaceae bacterium]
MDDSRYKMEEDGYWGSGQHGNRDEYERYLLIKNQLEDDPKHPRKNRKKKARGRVVSLLTYYPVMRWALALLLLVNVTHLLVEYQRHRTFFTWTTLYWCAASLVIWWYFARRDAGYGSLVLIDHFLPEPPFPRSLPLWGFLLGWILATLNPNDFRAWVPLIETLSRWCKFPISGAAFLSMNLPRMPFLLHLPGSLMQAVCGILIFVDIVASPWLKETEN